MHNHPEQLNYLFLLQILLHILDKIQHDLAHDLSQENLCLYHISNSNKFYSIQMLDILEKYNQNVYSNLFLTFITNNEFFHMQSFQQ